MVTNKKMTSSTYKTFHIGVFFERRTYRGSRIGGKKKKKGEKRSDTKKNIEWIPKPHKNVQMKNI